MYSTRVISALIVGSLMMSTAFAATPATTTPSTALTKDQISKIQKDCSKANGGSMSSDAYKSCVKTKENAAMASAPKKQ